MAAPHLVKKARKDNSAAKKEAILSCDPGNLMLKIVVHDRYGRGKVQHRTCTTWDQVDTYIETELLEHIELGDMVLVRGGPTDENISTFASSDNH